MVRFIDVVVIIAAVLSVTACSSGGSSEQDQPILYVVGGTVAGLEGDGLVLQINDGNDLALSSDGEFSFSASLEDGSVYTVSILAQPSVPNQTCSLNNETGSVAGNPITDISVTCTTNTYTISGNVSGLAGSGLVLQNNGIDDLVINADGDFIFASQLTDTSTYNVTVLSQPSVPNQTCSLNNETGSVSGNPVTNIGVTCTTNTYTISGSVTGLAGSGLVLQNNGTDDLVISADGDFIFATELTDSSTYNVTVLTQPEGPGQICSVSNGSASLAGSDVINVAVDCITIYTIGGNVTGLTGTGLVLQNNSGDDLVVNSDGVFSFSNAVTSASSYNVTVLSQPTNPSQLCNVSNSSGVVSSTDVTDVTIDCVNIYTISGVVTGLEATGLVLSNNNETLSIDADGAFSFVTPVIHGDSYKVEIQARPNTPRHGCHISNSYGKATSTVNNIAVKCTSLVGKFVTPNETVFTNISYDIEVGDIDNDGDPDYVTGNYQQPNTVFVNDGIGGFVYAGTISGSYDTYAVALADLDGDGDLDLVEGNYNTQANNVLFNDGTGQFNVAGTSFGSSSTSSLALGDVDNDGDIDVIEGASISQLWLNDGLGVFTNSGQVFTNSSTYAVVLGDVDNDGDLDLIEGNYNSGNVVWLNDGAGVFSDSGQSLGTSSTTTLSLADMDQDGDLDLFEAARLDAKVYWVNDGNGVFTDSGQVFPGASDITFGIETGDIDNDGDIDVLSASRGISGKPNRILLNDGTGTFTDLVWTTISYLTRSVALADFDGDGDMDVITANEGQENEILLNNQSNKFVNVNQALGSSDTKSIAVGDVNGDGFADILAGNYLQSHTLWYNDGFGNMEDSGIAFGSSQTVSIEIGDVGHDGDIDIIEANFGQANNIWWNDGTGQFLVQQLVEPEVGITTCMAVSDTNGYLEMVEGNFEQQNRVWGNETGSSLSFNTGFGDITSAPAYIVLGDVNGDGSNEIIESRNSTSTLVWSYSLSNMQYEIISVFPNSIVDLGDVDGDGDLDAIGSGVWINNGSGVFTSSGQSASGKVGDMDGDGDLDVVRANSAWLNDGTGIFTSTGQTFGLQTSIVDYELADIEGDGDLDLIIGNDAGGANRIYINLSR